MFSKMIVSFYPCGCMWYIRIFTYTRMCVFVDVRGKISYVSYISYTSYIYIYIYIQYTCVTRNTGESRAGIWRRGHKQISKMRGNKQILLNDWGDEQSAYLLALEDFCLLPVPDYMCVCV